VAAKRRGSPFYMPQRIDPAGFEFLTESERRLAGNFNKSLLRRAHRYEMVALSIKESTHRIATEGVVRVRCKYCEPSRRGLRSRGSPAACSRRERDACADRGCCRQFRDSLCTHGCSSRGRTFPAGAVARRTVSPATRPGSAVARFSGERWSGPEGARIRGVGVGGNLGRHPMPGPHPGTLPFRVRAHVRIERST
jgi:hypothetical protein